MGPFRKVGELLHRYFIPSEANGYRPDMLQKTAATGMLFLIILTFTLVNIQSIVLLTSEWLSSAILPSVLIDLTNENRADGSLGGLRHSALLDEAARLKAEDMAQNEYFAHDSPTGITPWYWFERVGYSYTYAGENLAVHFTDSDEVVDAWMKSPGHRANIMNDHYTEIGIGTAKGEYKGAPTIFVVQLFGRPMTRDQQVQVAAAERAEAERVVAEVEDSSPATTTSVIENTDVAGATEERPRVQETVPQETEVIIDLEKDAVVSSTPALGAEVAAVPTSTVPSFQGESVARLSEVATTSPYLTRGVITIPQGENGGNTAQMRESHILSQFAVRPHAVLSLLYALLALAIVGALGTSIVLEWRRAHAVQVAYGVGLIATMWVMLYVHVVLLGGVLIV